ncbi:MAG: TolC family protein [Kiritimatiellales bacterium]|nr:TolC family protein [Kiritimatiellales bacterium]MCF7864035.1 TolC family protein [Kiritimatiellales bacterium]
MISNPLDKISDVAEGKADRAAYGNIMASQKLGLGDSAPFTIDDEAGREVRSMLELDRTKEEPTLLSLSDALAIAIASSRSYQTRKETLFIQALYLTEVQKDFDLNYNGRVEADTSFSTYKDGSTETFGNRGANAGVDLGVTRKLATGARMTLNFSQNMLRYFTNPDTSDSNNALTFNIIQPLLNGFGPLVTKEPLRQAERDMVYAARDFKRYQQDFVIDISSQFYAALRTRDQMVNERNNYESTIANREQSESYAKAGRIADFQAAQARQSELNAADRWTIARAAYDRALDDFRFTLGLPIDLNVEPDPKELSVLEQRGLVDVDITLPVAMDSAISNRLDLINERQKVEDKDRKVEIQQRNFLPKLDVSYTVQKQFDSSDGTDISQNMGVGLELPFDWTEKRNSFRIAQINYEREKRNLESDESDVVRSVRDLWRKLESNRSVYANRLLSVKLAVRRVENTTLLLNQGKALTRDLLDAQSDLLSARNEATASLVDYTITRLRFWNAIERFEIDPKGMWYEKSIGQVEEAVATP